MFSDALEKWWINFCSFKFVENVFFPFLFQLFNKLVNLSFWLHHFESFEFLIEKNVFINALWHIWSAASSLEVYKYYAKPLSKTNQSEEIDSKQIGQTSFYSEYWIRSCKSSTISHTNSWWLIKQKEQKIEKNEIYEVKKLKYDVFFPKVLMLKWDPYENR